MSNDTGSASRPDLAIHDAVVVTMDDDNRIYESGTIIVNDGVFTDVRSTDDTDATIDADRVIDGDGRVVMPGLVNAHAHLELSALSGAFSEMDAGTLLAQMFPLYADIADGDYEYLLEASYDLAALTFLRSGITSLNTMDVRPAVGVDILGEAGLRATIGPAVSDLFWDQPVDAQIDAARNFVEEYHDSYDGRIRAAVCPHDDWSCSRELWERMSALADEYPDIPVHTHLLETEEGNEMSRYNGAEDTVDLLDEVGLLDECLIGAHFRVADEHDVERMGQAGAGVAHCPSVLGYYNFESDAQWTPVQDLRSAGVDVGLGLDDHYWHDSIDLFGEAREARLLANWAEGGKQYDSIELLRMATVESADAIGLDNVGSLTVGDRADLLVLDVDSARFTPLTNVPAQLVNKATRSEVETVVIDGDIVVDGGTVTTMDAEAVRQRVEAAVERFERETDWVLGLGTPDSPGTDVILRDTPKRGPARMVGRIGLQKAKERFGLE